MAGQLLRPYPQYTGITAANDGNRVYVYHSLQVTRRSAKGRGFLGNVSGLADKLVSGWGVNGIATFQAGFPLTLTTATNITDSFGGGSRPNYVGGCDSAFSGSSQSRITKWFNTASFTAPPAATFGNLGRTLTAVRTAGITNYDFSVLRNVAFTERYDLSFRERSSICSIECSSVRRARR